MITNERISPAKHRIIPPWGELDIGIYPTVQAVWDHGFEPIDSGDGQSKFKNETANSLLALPYLHVFMQCDPEHLVNEAKWLHLIVKGWGDLFVTTEAYPITASYVPGAGLDYAIIRLYGRLIDFVPMHKI